MDPEQRGNTTLASYGNVHVFTKDDCRGHGTKSLALATLALAGLFSWQTDQSADDQGKFQTDSQLFAIVIFATVILVIASTDLPTFALGPIVEHLQL